MRLIDADRLKLGFQVADKTLGLHGMLAFIEQGIDHAPTETERTSKITRSIGAAYFCINCKCMVFKDYNYCPNCGAKFVEDAK